MVSPVNREESEMKLLETVKKALLEAVFISAGATVVLIMTMIMTVVFMDAFIYENTGSCDGCVLLSGYFEWREAK